jgi:nicotinate-nucleotide pyrophosphorylase (carboxylating)
VQRARSGVPLLTKIEVECDTLDQVKQALDAGADVILLDNMRLDEMRRAVALVAGRVPLEASGGVRLETVRAIAETGVDFISAGRITQSAPAVDIGADIVLRR